MSDQIQNIISVNFGCDPEIFLAKGGQVIGAERVIPEEGLNVPTRGSNNYDLKDEGRKGIVLDGVQVELNPKPSNCRGLLGNELAAAFKALKKHLATLDGISASFTQVVEVDPKELEGLSAKAKALGCQPSENIYNSYATVGIDGTTNGQRSAGGHIHLGLAGDLHKHRERLVVLLDVLLGNTSVLIDRNPLNAQRRKNYGRAGEYRLPTHGLEYRTLSNFWLRAWPLTSGVLGISRLAVNVLASSLYGEFKGAEEILLRSVDIEAIQHAINTNDVKLAKQNYKVVRDYLAAHTLNCTTGLVSRNLEAFDFFISKIDTDGIEYWFAEDPMDHWTKTYFHTISHTRMQDGAQVGWESFLARVGTEMKTGNHEAYFGKAASK